MDGLDILQKVNIEGLKYDISSDVSNEKIDIV